MPNDFLIAPICVDNNKQWIGVLNRSMISDFHKHKNSNDHRLLRDISTNTQMPSQMISSDQREKLFILPFDYFWREWSKYGNIAAFILPRGASDRKNHLFETLPGIQKQTSDIDSLLRGMDYFFEKQYRESWKEFARITPQGSAIRDLLDEYKGMCAMYLLEFSAQMPYAPAPLPISQEYTSFIEANAEALKSARAKYLDLFDRAELTPGGIHGYVSLLWNYCWEANYWQAKEKLFRNISNYPENRQMLITLAEFMLSTGDYQGLAETTERITALSPHLSKYQLLHSFALYHTGDKKRARELFLRLPILIVNDNIDSVESDPSSLIQKLSRGQHLGDLIPMRWRWSFAEWNYLAAAFAIDEGRVNYAITKLEEAVKFAPEKHDFLKLYKQALTTEGSDKSLHRVVQIDRRMKLLEEIDSSREMALKNDMLNP